MSARSLRTELARLNAALDARTPPRVTVAGDGTVRVSMGANLPDLVLPVVAIGLQ